jgi:hypothetical protein
MKRDLGRLIERNLRAADAGALRPRRQSRFEPTAMDTLPLEGEESTRPTSVAGPLNRAAADREVDGRPEPRPMRTLSMREPLRRSLRADESFPGPPSRAFPHREAGEEVEGGREPRREDSALARGEPLHPNAGILPTLAVVARVMPSREPDGPEGAGARPSSVTRARQRGMLSAPGGRLPASHDDDGRGAPVIEVTIGRVDVRAVLPPASPPPPRPARSSSIPLEEYLRQRSRGGR